MVVWLRRLGWAACALLMLWVVAWLALPPLLKWQLPLRLGDALGRPVTIGALNLKPWSLSLTLNELAIGAAPGAPPARPLLLQVRRLHVDVSIASLFKRTPVIEALEIDAPQLSVARTAPGHYDIDDLIERFKPRADDPSPSGEPARFALYNLQVRDASLRFDDQPQQRVHRIDSLQLALPFISNLLADVEIKVEPLLTFRLDGTTFGSGALATPFALNRNGALQLAMNDLDLAPYLGYLPTTLPVRLLRGSISADLSLQFEMPPGKAPMAVLKGTVDASNFALGDPAGHALFDWKRLQLELREVHPLTRKLAFESLRIDGLQVHATRDAAGQINLLQWPVGGGPADASARSVAPERAAPAASTAGARTADAAPWQISLESLDLADAGVHWSDAAVAPAAALRLGGLDMSARQLEWPMLRPMRVSMNAELRAQAAGAPLLGTLRADGQLSDIEASLALTLAQVPLGGFAPYLAQALVPGVDGRLAARGRLEWSARTDAPRLRVAIDELTLDALKLRESDERGAPEAASVKQLALGDVQVDLLARSVVLGSVKLLAPSVALARDRSGQFNVQRWAAGTDAPRSAASAAPPTSRAPPPAGVPWRLQVDELAIDGGQLQFTDAIAPRGTGAAPLRFTLADLRLAVQGMAWRGERNSAAANVQLSARIGGGAARERVRSSGAIDYKGRLGMQPWLATGALRIERLPVHLFAPYFADRLPVTLLRAQAGYTGNLTLREQPDGFEANAAGDVLLGDVLVAEAPAAGAPVVAMLPAGSASPDELLSWQSLALKGVKLSMRPKARAQIEIGEAALSDFYSRLVITEQGRFNLRDVATGPTGAASGVAPTAVSASAVTPAPVSASAVAPAANDANGAAGSPFDIRVGGTRLSNGRIDFTDRFVRPNYSAQLTELNGSIGAFSSGSRAMATLELRGRAAGTALLEISGQLNPSVTPLALDIRARATDLELAPLSPYAGKYAGYAIQRGKLSMDVAYKIDADGRLDAKNQVVLNQLTFGDRVESKDATKLPVLLAVALLKDRNGVIDLNLPVSGSINDPQFSVGGIIVKVIVNMLTRAITAPFALLAGGSGGADDLSLVEFEPGTALIKASGTAAIDKVAKALTDRPTLKMTVTGAADPASEREAFQRAAIDARLRAGQRREAPLATASDAAASAAPLGGDDAAMRPWGADERTRLLKALYKDTELPNKPRNLIGLAKDIPAAEMESLLMGRMPVTSDAMRELALQRGIAVRDALIARGLPSERLFMGAPKLRGAGDDNAAWTPRVQLALSIN